MAISLFLKTVGVMQPYSLFRDAPWAAQPFHFSPKGLQILNFPPRFIFPQCSKCYVAISVFPNTRGGQPPNSGVLGMAECEACRCLHGRDAKR